MLLVEWLWFVRISTWSSRICSRSLTKTIEVVANYIVNLIIIC